MDCQTRNNHRIVVPLPDHGGAGLLTSLTETDGLAELPEALTQLEPEMAVDFIPCGELL
jgi:molybdopterin biosynthesis enzyme